MIRTTFSTPRVGSRLSLLKRTPALIVLLVFSQLAAGEEAPQRLNVLLIICDNLNTQITPYTSSGAETPVLAQLASSGVVFDRAYCQHSQEGASRASFLSGRYPEATGAISDGVFLRNIAPEVVPLPQHLKQHGYWTASAGRVFQKTRSDYDRLAWDRVVSNPDDHLPIVVEAHKRFVKEHGPIQGARTLWKEHIDNLATQTRGETMPGYGPSGMADEAHADGKNARDVARWLREKPYGDKPFFIAFGLNKPHLPWVVPDEYFRMYAGVSFGPAATKQGEWQDKPSDADTLRYRQFGFRKGEPNPDMRQTYMRAYFAAASFADAQIGVVIDALDASGQRSDTVILFCSDVGYHLGDHERWGKNTLFENCLRVPFIIHSPGVSKNGSRSAVIVSLIDLFPTITELCGVPPAAGVQGVSLAGLLTGQSSSVRQAAYSMTSRSATLLGRSLRTDRWRYTEWRSPRDAELYDYENDPNEFENLAGRTEFAELQQQLRSKLDEARLEAVGDTD